MAGIYIHIPFCRKACHYCNFHFSTQLQHLEEVKAALLKEALLRKDYLTEPVETIYFGGGTPSLLPAPAIAELTETLHQYYSVTATPEITLEANPDDMSEEKAHAWAAAGINRLSIGVQSFYDEDLRWMNRAHNAKQAWESILFAHQAGIHNITIDLIYGVPGLTDDRWAQNIETALENGVTHLSCYALTVEPATALKKMIDKHKVQDIDEAQQARQFELLMQTLEKAGWQHYEISNFAKPGYRSRHNSNYWKGVPYLGLGPSAHSFNGTSRQWNVANNALYLKSLEQNAIPFEIEYLSIKDQVNEYIMTSLRTMEGLSLKRVEGKWGSSLAQSISADAAKYIEQRQMEIVNQRLVLTNAGKLMADGIAGEMFRS